MPPDLLAGMSDRIIVIIAVLAVAAVVRALASVLRTWIEQEARTRRFTRAIEGAKPSQRSEIIEACGQLEGRSPGRADDEEDGMPPAANGQSDPAVLVLQHKRTRECDGELR